MPAGQWRPQSQPEPVDRCRRPLCCVPDRRSEERAYLTGRIDYLGRKLLASTLNGVTEGVFDGGIIALHKMSFDKSNRQ